MAVEAVVAAGSDRGVTAACGIIEQVPTRTNSTRSSQVGNLRLRRVTDELFHGNESRALASRISHCSQVPKLGEKKAKRCAPLLRACNNRSDATTERNPTH